MCGIAGVFAVKGTLDPRQEEAVARLNRWQAHRGPDGEGLWVSSDRSLILGHRRLAIIDTGPSGAQPMSDASGRWTVTFNGEIYNYRALRDELRGLGRHFATASDTEVLINAIAQWGEAALTRLRGMFAFALWDGEKRELWLARDPYGIKPLYAAVSGNHVWFASQARALAECAPVSSRRDAAALVGFHLWGSVPEPFSWWADIRPLPAGHLQRFTAAGTGWNPRPYYSVPDRFARPGKGPKPNELRELLATSVEDHLVADTDVGVFLSAGIDSNVIAKLASSRTKRLKTITLAFREYEGTQNDEAPSAEASARALGTQHTTVRIDREEFDALLADFFAKMDQPSIDGLNTYLIARAAARCGLKVALSGLGADELFGGYPSFRQIPPLVSLGSLLPVAVWAGKGLERLSRPFFPRLFLSKHMSVLAHSGSLGDAYLLRRCVHLKEELDLVLDRSWIEEGMSKLEQAAVQDGILAPLGARSAWVKVAALESCCYLRNQLLRDADWAGMAHGVEIRVPFVDRVVLEALGPAIASKRPPRKRDLAALAGLHPAQTRRRKTGFVTPAFQWAAGETLASRHGLKNWSDLVWRRMRVDAERPAAERSEAGQEPVLGAAVS